MYIKYAYKSFIHTVDLLFWLHCLNFHIDNSVTLFLKVAEELECGVAPFKEENVRLYKENSHLRLGLAKALEEAEDKARGTSFT